MVHRELRVLPEPLEVQDSKGYKALLEILVLRVQLDQLVLLVLLDLKVPLV